MSHSRLDSATATGTEEKGAIQMLWSESYYLDEVCLAWRQRRRERPCFRETEKISVSPVRNDAPLRSGAAAVDGCFTGVHWAPIGAVITLREKKQHNDCVQTIRFINFDTNFGNYLSLFLRLLTVCVYFFLNHFVAAGS